MKIAGIAGKKHANLKRGDVIELSPDQKAEEFARDAVIKESPEGKMFIPMAVEIIGEVLVIKGRKDVKNPEPNQYKGTALVEYRISTLATDKVSRVKKMKVSFLGKDSKDNMGVADLELVEHKVL